VKKRPVSSKLKISFTRYSSSTFRTIPMPRSAASLSMYTPSPCSLTDVMPVRDKNPRK